MEDTLGVYMFLNQDAFSICLNPCFNGRYSRSYKEVAGFYRDVVLILVLMEDTLGDVKFRQ